jgi:type VI secretion system protein ImpE
VLVPIPAPGDLFREGKLVDAVAAQTALVRSSPADVNHRWFLAELLCFAEQWERADQALDVIAAQAAGMVPAVLRFRGLLRGEQTRRQVMGEGRAPELIGSSSASLQPVVEALLCLGEGQPEAAARLIETAVAAAPAPSGFRNTTLPFDVFRDLDDVCSLFVEFITEGGDYHWVSAVDLALLEPQELTRARDLIWRPCRLEIRDGPAGNVYLPAAYVADNINVERDDALRLCRRTEWCEMPGPLVRGVGLRTFLVGDEDVPLHELGTLTFSGVGGAL